MFEHLWKEIVDYALELKVKPEQLFAYRILKEVEEILRNINK